MNGDLYYTVSAIKDKADSVVDDLDDLVGLGMQLDEESVPDPEDAAEFADVRERAAVATLSALSDLWHVLHQLRDIGADIEIAPFEDDVLVTHLANAKLMHDKAMDDLKWITERMHDLPHQYKKGDKILIRSEKPEINAVFEVAEVLDDGELVLESAAA